MGVAEGTCLIWFGFSSLLAATATVLVVEVAVNNQLVVLVTMPHLLLLAADQSIPEADLVAD